MKVENAKLSKSMEDMKNDDKAKSMKSMIDY